MKKRINALTIAELLAPKAKLEIRRVNGRMACPHCRLTYVKGWCLADHLPDKHGVKNYRDLVVVDDTAPPPIAAEPAKGDIAHTIIEGPPDAGGYVIRIVWTPMCGPGGQPID